ncbi:MAG: AbrB/MazE/SpoVT family DNA-binding domain-containing protein [Candidatus Sumerlaeaceae bacterium]
MIGNSASSRYKGGGFCENTRANNLVVRVPKAIAAEAQLQEGSEIEMQHVDGELVIKPLRPQFSLDELLKGVRKSNLHSEAEWGPAVGREVW